MPGATVESELRVIYLSPDTLFQSLGGELLLLLLGWRTLAKPRKNTGSGANLSICFFFFQAKGPNHGQKDSSRPGPERRYKEGEKREIKKKSVKIKEEVYGPDLSIFFFL